MWAMSIYISQHLALASRERDALALVSKEQRILCVLAFDIRHGAAFLQYSQTWHSGAVKVLIMTYYS